MSETQNLKKYDFSSVGQTQEEFQKSLVDTTANIPVGIKTPMEVALEGSSGPFKMRSDLGAQIKDNFRNMLSTNHGERLALYDFGANLQDLVFELGTETQDLKAINRIKKTTAKYMPFIQLNTFEPVKEEDISSNDLAFIGIRVTYSVPNLGLGNQAVEVILYTAG